jgi:uncharacterized protein YydD (DUF2326 family)
MIKCDKFAAAHREICFHSGLNTILGSEGGSNAIGKSTLLLIIDFCFGGDWYVKLPADVYRNIGEHRIDFIFRFEEKDFYFSRSTKDAKTVRQYSDDFKTEITRHTVEKFRNLLKEYYNLERLPFGVKELSERFFRISGCKNSNPNEPLRVAKSWDSTDFIMALLQSFDIIKDLKEKAEAFGVEVSKLLSQETKTDYSSKLSKIETEIKALSERLKKEQQKYNSSQLDLLSFDPDTDDKIRAISEELKNCGQYRSQYQSLYTAIKNNAKHQKDELVFDFSPLLKFFPNANVVEFSKLESFHQKMGEQLSEEISEEINRLEPVVNYYEQEIKRLKTALEETNVAKDISEQSLAACVNIKIKTDSLEKEKEKIVAEQEKQRERIKAQKQLTELLAKQRAELKSAAKNVNNEMKRINKFITLDIESPPRLNFKENKEFDFQTPDNRSDGTACKSLVIFDLAMLTLTPLPAIIHDSSTLFQIEVHYLEKILEFYNGEVKKLNKQVFIAFDKAATYSPESQIMLAETACVHLSDENTLYGVSWSKHTKK